MKYVNESVHSRGEEGVAELSFHDEYPHELYANVLLLDNKIECWKVGFTKAEGYWPFRAYWKKDRIMKFDLNTYAIISDGDYVIKTKTWIVNNDQEHNDVFEKQSKEWFRQWQHADDYKLGRAY